MNVEREISDMMLPQSISRVLAWWAFFTIAGALICFALSFRLPPDEIDVMTSVGFRLVVSFFMSGLVSLFLLFLFLLFAAIFKKRSSSQLH